MNLQLTLACGQYDRTIPLQDGTVRPEGIDLTLLPMTPGEIFRRQARYLEFDVCEFSLATYLLLHAQGDRRLVAIPVFPSRKFRHSEIFVNTRAGIRAPQDLKGRRVGTGEYQQTAAVWMRGFLQHDYGVHPEDIHWQAGGYNAPTNYSERVPFDPPAAVRMDVIPNDRSLDQLLDAGEIDALMGPERPLSFRRGSPNVARLFPNYREVESDYYRRTGIFPIMHTVVLGRELYEKHPWAAVNLYKAFALAQAAGQRRLGRAGTLYCSLPWIGAELDDLAAAGWSDMFAYGLEANRAQLETFLGYCLEQGLISRPVGLEDLFAPETHDVFVETDV